jgi:hypothetical protein
MDCRVVAAPFVLAFALLSCGHSNREEGTPTMVPTASGPAEAVSTTGGSCTRLALCCREIYALGSGSGGAARTACGSLASIGTGGAGSDAACAASLAQVVSIASVSGVLPASCRGPEAAALGGLGVLAPRIGSRGRVTPLTIPSTVTGTFVTGDATDSDGSLYDEFRVFLSSGSSITLVARGGASRTSPGSNLDMYLVLLQNGVEVTHDDDSAGSLNSRIVYTPTTSGFYQVRVRTFGGGAKEGDYTLQSWTGSLPGAT